MGFFSQRNDWASDRPKIIIEDDTPPPPKRLRPTQPCERKESGLSARLIESLLLKTIKQEGCVGEAEISAVLHLAPGCFRNELQSLYKRGCIDSPSPQRFDLTTKGRELAGAYEEEDAYLGPAPVTFQEYCAMVLRQAGEGRRITQEEFDAAFAHMPAPFEMRRMLKEAFNSRQVLIFWGPPGNGKSLWSDSLHALLRDPVLLPHAIEFNNKVIQYFDPAYHQPLAEVMAEEEAAFANTPTAGEKPDRRWLVCKPPLVTVGTEFRVEHFEIAFDGKFHAPPHLKANNGIFIFDDLGRQTQDHNMILNQFIYPLEQQETIIKFVGGSSLRAPYKQRLFLSTNLNFRAIIDDAFARRLLYQVLVDRPSDEDWKRILIGVAKKQGVEEEALLAELARKLVYWFKRDGRVIRAADPRNLFRMLDATLDEGETLAEKLDLALWERIYRQYPAAYEKDATGYVVEQVDDDAFRAQFAELAGRHGVDPALVEVTLRHFHAQGRFLRPVDAPNLFAMADGARDSGQTIADYVTPATWQALLAEYPNFTAADAKRMRGTVGLGGK